MADGDYAAKKKGHYGTGRYSATSEADAQDKKVAAKGKARDYGKEG